MRKFIPWVVGGGLLVLASCSAPTAPVSEDTVGPTCNGVVIRTGYSCEQ